MIFLVAVFFSGTFSSSLAGEESSKIERLLGDGEIYLALELVEEELSRKPADLGLLRKAGELKFQVGEFDQGSQHFKSLFSRSDKPAEILVALARLQEDASLYEAASEVARQALKIDPQVSGARVVLARCLLAGLHHEEAYNLLVAQCTDGSAEREELHAYGRALLGMGKFEEASAVLGRVIDPAAELRDLCDLGEALNGSREYQRAADLLTSALERDPSFVRAYYLLGTALMRLGKSEGARPLLETYRSMANLEDRWYFPDMESAGFRNQVLYEKALLFTVRGRYRSALSGFLKAAALRPDDGPVVLTAAAQLAEMEATVEAWAILERSLKREVTPVADFLFQSGEVLRLSGQTEKARDWFQRSLKTDPNHAGALLRLGQVSLQTGLDSEKTLNLLQRAQKLAPEEWEPSYWLGQAALVEQQTEQARTYFQEAGRLLGGSNAEILSALGHAELQAGRVEEGSRLLLSSMKLSRTLPSTFAGLEQGLKSLGDPTGASTAQKMRLQAEEIEMDLSRVRSSSKTFEERGEDFLRLARLYQKLGASIETVKYYRLARAAAPDLTEPYRQLAAMAVGPGEVLYRASNLRGVLRIEPRDAEATRELALLYAKLGVQLNQAQELARRSVAVEDVPEGHYVLAEVLLQQGNLDTAKQEAETAYRVTPNDERFLDLVNRVNSELTATAKERKSGNKKVNR